MALLCGLAVALCAAPQARAEDEHGGVQTFVAAGVLGVGVAHPLGREEDGPEPEFDFTLGRSVTFNLQAANSFAVGLALDFVGLDLDEDIRRYAAQLAWGELYASVERATIAGKVDGQRFEYAYDTYMILYADRHASLSQGVGLIRFSEPRGSWYTEGLGADDVYDEFNRDPKVTETAFGYVMKMDSLMQALKQGYVTGGLASSNDFQADSGMSLVVDTMVLAGLAWVEPSKQFKDHMNARYGLSPDGSLTFAAYSQAEVLLLFYKGWDLVRLAVTVGARLRLAGSGGGEPSEGVTYAVSPILHFGPVARLGLIF